MNIGHTLVGISWLFSEYLNLVLSRKTLLTTKRKDIEEMCHDNQRELEMNGATSEERRRECRASKQSIRPCSVTRMNGRRKKQCGNEPSREGKRGEARRGKARKNGGWTAVALRINVTYSSQWSSPLLFSTNCNAEEKWIRNGKVDFLFFSFFSSEAFLPTRKEKGTFLGQSEYRQYSRGLEEEKQMKKLIYISTYQIKQLQ